MSGTLCDEAASHQLPIAVGFWIIQVVSTGEFSSLMQNLIQICCCTHSVILNVMATQYTFSHNWHLLLPLTNTVKSSLFTHVHSSPLSLAARLPHCHANHSHYLTTAGLFPNRSHILYMTLKFPFYYLLVYSAYSVIFSCLLLIICNYSVFLSFSVYQLYIFFYYLFI